MQWLSEPARNLSAKDDSRAADRPPLDGVTVLDFASYIAGSYGPMILAQLGAKVIKIESLEGDSFRHFGFGFLGWNQGKRGLSVNLETDRGREIIHGLVDKADIVVENLRPGRMRKFGVDYEASRRAIRASSICRSTRSEIADPITISPASIRCCRRVRV